MTITKSHAFLLLLIILIVVVFLSLRFIPGAPWFAVRCPSCIYDSQTCQHEYNRGYTTGLAGCQSERPPPQECTYDENTCKVQRDSGYEEGYQVGFETDRGHVR